MPGLLEILQYDFPPLNMMKHFAEEVLCSHTHGNNLNSFAAQLLLFGPSIKFTPMQKVLLSVAPTSGKTLSRLQSIERPRLYVSKKQTKQYITLLLAET